MGRGEEDVQLKAAKRGYREAGAEGNHEEEARWANVIGDILKRRGEYVEALRWLRVDYEVSVKHLPQKQLLPTCQSLGEVYLRLEHFKDALTYQKKHLRLAEESSDLVEQQRASTQLGRTYHEIFLRSETDHYALRNAKKYFKSAMKLARTLKENPSCHKSSLFLKEFIDAHNNLGMLEMDLDNLEESLKSLLQGLKICNEEEVNENDDTHSRLHHNLGSLYLELRDWSKAKGHIERDISICKGIDHPQGEAKGYINLGELHYRLQKYEDAILCYQKALNIARSMEDEDALADQIDQNIKTVKEATKVLDELKKEEQKLKKLTRITYDARGTENERKCLLEQHKCLECLIEKSRTIFAWQKHLEFSKRKKRVANELCDKIKLSESYLDVGESYQKLRKFSKARKWYMKSWNIWRSIGNLEGQALAKINIGEVLDSSGDWPGALEAFEEGYRISVENNLPSVQLSALENMHYSHMIRFDNLEQARKVQDEIQNLKQLLNEDYRLRNLSDDHCSETETEGTEMSDFALDTCEPPNVNGTASSRPTSVTSFEGFDDDIPLVSLIHPRKNLSKSRMAGLDSHGKKCISCKTPEGSSRGASKSFGCPQHPHKRARLVISDDELDEMDHPSGKLHGNATEDVATSDGDKRCDEPIGLDNDVQDISHLSASKDVLSACTPVHLEESTSSFKSKSPNFTAENGLEFGSLSDSRDVNAPRCMVSGSKMDSDRVSGSLLHSQDGTNFHLHGCEDEDGHSITFRVGDYSISVDTRSCMDGDKLSVDCMKVEVACLYYLHLSEEKRSKGLLPVIQSLRFCGKDIGLLESIEDFKDRLCGKGWIEVVIDGWVPKRLMKLYIDCCQKLSETPNMRLLKKLYSLEVSEDEVVVSECGLQDVSILPFLDSLQVHKTVAVLDISHNLLGNETMEKLKQIFTSSNQRYGGLTLDLHCNRFGPTALFQICECPVLLSRLEVLNLSENRLTDACSSYLSTILLNCKALYSLNIEQCSITSRTIQKIADVLGDESVLSQLYIGRTNPISGNTMINLFNKLAALKRFSELSLNSVKLNKPMVDGLCQLARSSSLSALMLGGTNVGADGAIRLTEALSSGPQELVKFDLSYCGLISQDITKVCANIALIGGLVELNLGGNSVGNEGCLALASLLVDPQCCLKVLILDKCHLGLTGIVQTIQALAG